MKRLILACAALAASAVIATPALAGTSASPPVKTPGTLTVGLSLPSPGFQTGTIRGTNVVNPKGMEVEMAMDIAKKLGIKTVKFYNVSNFSNIYSSAPKPYDFALAEVTITPARAKAVAFSTPYYNANQGVLIRKGLTPGADEHRGSEEARPVRADRHDRRRLHQEQDPPDQDRALPVDDHDHVPAGAVRPL